MSRIAALLACFFALSACSSLSNWSVPNMDIGTLRGSPGGISVRVESQPEGAEARLPSGQGCRTPCSLSIPASGTTTISFALQGYLPQTVPVTVTVSGEASEASDIGVAPMPRVDPNPVFAALEIAPPPPPPPRKKAPPRRRTAAPPPPPPPPPAAQPAPGFGPPPQQQAPPPGVFR
jgi:hypothetical protein